MTPGDKDRAGLFVQLLLEAVKDKECRISVVITMRSEFLGDCALFFGLAEQVNDGTFLLPRMTRDQIEEVILGPAEEQGFTIDPVVVQELLNETEKQDDGLPLLQHALRRIHRYWQKRGADGPISVQDLSSFETDPPEGALLIKHHLDDHLDSIYASLGADGKLAAKRLFRLLSERDSRGRVTRRPRPFSDIVKYSGEELRPQIEAVIEAFRDERNGRTFLTPGWPDPFQNSVIDISHECLLRRWDKLGKWILQEQQDAEQFKRLAGDADEADRQARKKGAQRKPLEGTTLAAFLKWREKSKLVNAAWALAYEGEFSKELGRPAQSFAAADDYLRWSAEEAEQRAKKARLDDEAKIRSEERARQAEIETQLVEERRLAGLRRRKAMIIILSLIIVVLAVLFAYRSANDRLREQAARAEYEKSSAQNAAQQQSLAESKKREEVAQANAAEQKRLRDAQSKAADDLRKSVGILEGVRQQLSARNIDLDRVNNDLKKTSDSLQKSLDDLNVKTGELTKATATAQAEASQKAAALDEAKKLQAALQREANWVEALVVAGEVFGDSYRQKSGRRDSILDVLDYLEQATEEMGKDAQIKELYDVRKSGLKALSDAIAPELAMSVLQTGPGETACYAEDTQSISSLLITEGLRDRKGFVQFAGSRNPRAGFLDPVRRQLERIYRRSWYVRLKDPDNARAFSDDCRTVAIGSTDGLVDFYKPTDAHQGYFFPSLPSVHQRGGVESVRLSPDGQYAVASFTSHGWRVWALPTERLVRSDDGQSIASAAFSPNGRWLLLVEPGGKTSVIDLNTSPNNSRVRPALCCQTSAGVRQQSDISNDGGVVSFEGGTSRILYVGSNEPDRYFGQQGRANLRAVRLSPDGRFIAAGADDGSVDLWDIQDSNEVLGHFPDQSSPTSPVSTLSWSKSGQYLTVLHSSGVVRVWQINGTSPKKAEPIRDLLRQIAREIQKDKPADTREMARTVRGFFPRQLPAQ